jgi:phospholipid transport system substrate-binding protein
MTRTHRWLGLSLFTWFAFAPVTAFAVTPTEQLQATIQQVLTIVNGSEGQRAARRKEQLRETLMPRFDRVEMARQTLGKHWDNVPSRHGEFVSAFADFMGNSYVGKIGSYKDEKILFVEETVNQHQALVKTKIVPTKGEATAVNYKLHRIDDEWKVYDVVVEDISLVVNFRSQFNRILAKGSFDDLLRQMKEKETKNRN